MSEDKPEKLDVWGSHMLNKCNKRLRNRRKRDAGKKRRLIDKERANEK